MQISSNHSGFNFSSVYKSVVTRQIEPAAEASPARAAAFEINSDRREEDSERVHREALLLQTAHRAAERTASLLAATHDL